MIKEIEAIVGKDIFIVSEWGEIFERKLDDFQVQKEGDKVILSFPWQRHQWQWNRIEKYYSKIDGKIFFSKEEAEKYSKEIKIKSAQSKVERALLELEKLKEN